MSRKSIFRRNIVYFCIAAAVLAFAVPSFAAKLANHRQKAVPAKAASDLAMHKKALISDINARLDSLREKQACIKLAKDKDAVQQCLNPLRVQKHKKPAPQKHKPAAKL